MNFVKAKETCPYPNPILGLNLNLKTNLHTTIEFMWIKDIRQKPKLAPKFAFLIQDRKSCPYILNVSNLWLKKKHLNIPKTVYGV
jgi:hypothetical protein